MVTSLVLWGCCGDLWMATDWHGYILQCACHQSPMTHMKICWGWQLLHWILLSSGRACWLWCYGLSNFGEHCSCGKAWLHACARCRTSRGASTGILYFKILEAQFNWLNWIIHIKGWSSGNSGGEPDTHGTPQHLPGSWPQVNKPNNPNTHSNIFTLIPSPYLTPNDSISVNFLHQNHPQSLVRFWCGKGLGPSRTAPRLQRVISVSSPCCFDRPSLTAARASHLWQTAPGTVGGPVRTPFEDLENTMDIDELQTHIYLYVYIILNKLCSVGRWLVWSPPKVYQVSLMWGPQDDQLK